MPMRRREYPAGAAGLGRGTRDANAVAAGRGEATAGRAGREVAPRSELTAASGRGYVLGALFVELIAVIMLVYMEVLILETSGRAGPCRLHGEDDRPRSRSGCVFKKYGGLQAGMTVTWPTSNQQLPRMSGKAVAKRFHELFTVSPFDVRYHAATIVVDEEMRTFNAPHMTVCASIYAALLFAEPAVAWNRHATRPCLPPVFFTHKVYCIAPCCCSPTSARLPPRAGPCWWWCLLLASPLLLFFAFDFPRVAYYASE